MDMQMQSVKSSNVKSAGYDPTSATLQIEFQSGVSYKYADVSPDEWAAFEKTFDDDGESAGAFFRENFRYGKKTTKV